MLTFAVFYAIAVARGDNSILAGQAFASLSLISLITLAALTFIKAIPALVQCFSSFERIQEYCSQPVRAHHVSQNLELSSASSGVELSVMNLRDSQAVTELPLVRFSDQDVAHEKAGAAILKTMKAEIRARRFTVIVGPTGGGKSTLMESILDETVSLRGETQRLFSTAAYCAQIPWLFNGSIRENIVANPASPMDDKWYDTVLWACGLENDIANLSYGDQTPVGNGGSNLSGGQRQRIVSTEAES